MTELDLEAVTTDDAAALDELERWLSRDPELRQVRRSRPATPPNPDELGVVSDAIKLVTDNSALLTAIATSIGVWLGTRAKRTRIRIRLGDRMIELDTQQKVDPEELAKRLVAELRT